jgi:hypothetical protein
MLENRASGADRSIWNSALSLCSRLPVMLHNELITEFPCDGELVRVEQRSTRWQIVLRCRLYSSEISSTLRLG